MPLLLLAACAGGPQGRKAAAGEDPARGLYETGRAAVLNHDYAGAIAAFRRMTALYPGHSLTPQARMELAYSYFKTGATFSAIAEAEGFINDYPRHATLDYLYYLRGLAAYEHSMAFLDQQTRLKTNAMPPLAQLTLQYFTALLERFPDSKYSEDAQARLAHLQEAVARLEVQRAKQALAKGDYASATLLAKAVMEKYPLTPYSREAAALVSMSGRVLEQTAAGTVAPATAAAAKAAEPHAQTQAAPMAAPPPARPPATAAVPGADAESAAHKSTPPAPVIPARPQKDTPATTGDKASRREDWLLSQEGSAYTLQLLGTGRLHALQQFIRHHGLEDKAAYFAMKRDGHPWYTLVYGVYPDRKTAQAAAATLPEKVRALRPWPRRLAVIQDLIHGGR